MKAIFSIPTVGFSGRKTIPVMPPNDPKNQTLPYQLHAFYI
jgi:hypothetical protein